jgi:hypothetical protein
MRKLFDRYTNGGTRDRNPATPQRLRPIHPPASYSQSIHQHRTRESRFRRVARPLL